jgi:hypothetical protein
MVEITRFTLLGEKSRMSSFMLYPDYVRVYKYQYLVMYRKVPVFLDVNKDKTNRLFLLQFLWFEYSVKHCVYQTKCCECTTYNSTEGGQVIIPFPSTFFNHYTHWT